MARDVMQDIRDTYRNLDINSQESEWEAQAEVDSMAGDVDETPAEDASAPDARPLDNAIEILRVSKSPVFQEIFGALKALHAECVAKSKDEKQTPDFRSLNHTKGLGVEQSIGVFTAILEESEARLKSATPAERRAMGKDANQFISDLISPVVASEPEVESRSTSSVTGPPSATVQANTKKARAFFKKSDASRS
jgi:hypothetical protein